MAWQQLILHTDSAMAETLSDFLTELGALSVSYEDDADTPIYEPPPGTTPLWSATRLVALFETDIDTGAIIRQIEQRFGAEAVQQRQWQFLEDRQWETQWMDHFHAMRFGQRLWICPSWQEIPDPKAVNILLDPGLAFGTGTHPTTALCLEWLDANPPHNARVLDFGCGSGILAVAAARLGAAAVWATDIDPQALQATRSNADNNGVSEKISVVEPAKLPQMQYDVLLANILANPLQELAEQFAAYVKSGGQFIISGFLDHQLDDLKNCYSRWFEITDCYRREQWLALAGKRK